MKGLWQEEGPCGQNSQQPGVKSRGAGAQGLPPRCPIPHLLAWGAHLGFCALRFGWELQPASRHSLSGAYTAVGQGLSGAGL